MYPRSKSHIFKKSNAMNVVQETQEENNKELEFKRTKLSSFQFNDDILMTNSIQIKFETLISLPKEPITPKIKSNSKSKTISSLMDPVYEVKEEADDKNEKVNKVMNSPRIKYLTDFKEDVIPSKKVFSSIHNTFHKVNYEMEKDEVITEDNNENIPEEGRKVKKKESSHKFLESFIDKTDSVISDEVNLNDNQLINVEEPADFETIKEEIIEDDEKETIHKISESIFIIFNILAMPIADEVGVEGVNMIRSSSHRLAYVKPEDNIIINDPITENVDEEKLTEQDENSEV